MLSDAVVGGPLYCRVVGHDAGRVRFVMIYHRDDGSERPSTEVSMPVERFFESSFGGWYEGDTPPRVTPMKAKGMEVPLKPGRREGGSQLEN